MQRIAGFLIKNRAWFLSGFMLVIIYFPIFLHLDALEFRMWDESFNGINAIEMAHNHQYIVTYSCGAPDMMNLKPPLQVWCVVLLAKLFGFSELTLRLPSALAGVMLCIFLFYSLRKYTGSNVYAFMVVAVLVTCRGYIRNHVTRTGEYDSLLVLFCTLFSLQLFLAIESVNRKEQSRHLLLFFIFLTLAVLTKEVAGLMFLPGLFIYTLIRKKALVILKDKSFCAGVLIFLVFVCGYYLLRESLNPGYLKAVWNSDLGGSYLSVNSGHPGPVTFYFPELIQWQFVSYMFVFPAALLAGMFFCGAKIRNIVWFAALTGGAFFIVISLAKTKLPHYDAPVFPFLAMITASLFYFLYTAVKEKLNNLPAIAASGLAFAILMLLYATPYLEMLKTVYFPKGDSWDEPVYDACRFLRLEADGKLRFNHFKVVDNTPRVYGKGAVIQCYIEELHDRGISASIAFPEEVHPGDKIVALENSTFAELQKRFGLDSVQHAADCSAVILSVKKAI